MLLWPRGREDLGSVHDKKILSGGHEQEKAVTALNEEAFVKIAGGEASIAVAGKACCSTDLPQRQTGGPRLWPRATAVAVVGEISLVQSGGETVTGRREHPLLHLGGDAVVLTFATSQVLD